MTEEIDEMLREYAPRWRATQPPPPSAGELVRRAQEARKPVPARRWAPLVAVAAVVVLIAAGVAVLRPHLSAEPSPATSSTAPSGTVAWAVLPPTGTVVPSTTTPESPDPSAAQALSPCQAAALRVSSSLEGALGTRYRLLEITSKEPCRLGGYPSVTALNPRGGALDVPIEQEQQQLYTGPAAVGPNSVAVLRIGWASAWCVAEINVAKLRVVLPDNGGTITVDGFGPSACNADPGSGSRTPITVGSFRPQAYTEATVATAFRDVDVELRLPGSVPAGGELRFEVVLTARTNDVDLSVCPDYTMSLGTQSWSYALNCAGVAYRNAAGHPELPIGTPVSFEMRLPAPATPAGAVKLTWMLSVADAVGGGGTIDVS